MKKTIIAILFTTALVCSSASAQDFYKKINFAKGSTHATHQFGLVRGDNMYYHFNARKGQKIKIKIKSLENNAIFELFKSDSNAPISGYGKKYWQGSLPNTGRYELYVGNERGNSEYTIEIDIEN